MRRIKILLIIRRRRNTREYKGTQTAADPRIPAKAV